MFFISRSFSRVINFIQYLQFIGTINGLSQTISISQIWFQFEYIHLFERHHCQCCQFPVQQTGISFFLNSFKNRYIQLRKCEILRTTIKHPSSRRHLLLSMFFSVNFLMPSISADDFHCPLSSDSHREINHEIVRCHRCELLNRYPNYT